jgi:hypothetical protein
MPRGPRNPDRSARHHPTGPRPGRGHSAVDPARPLKGQAISINLKIPDIRELKPRITVFGVGGAGAGRPEQQEIGALFDPTVA